MIKEMLNEPAFVLVIVLNLGVLAIALAIRLFDSMLPVRVRYSHEGSRADVIYTLVACFILAVLVVGVIILATRL